MFFAQNLKNQIMTTNLWVEQVKLERVISNHEIKQWNYIVNSTGTITSCNGIRRITAASTCSTSRRKTFGDRISSFTTSKLISYTTIVCLFFKSGSRSKYGIHILNSFDNNNEQYNPIWSARLAHVRNIVPMATLRWRCLPKPPCTIAGWLSGSRRLSTNPVARSMSNISHSTNRRACSNSAVGHTTDSRSRSRTLLFILIVRTTGVEFISMLLLCYTLSRWICDI